MSLPYTLDARESASVLRQQAMRAERAILLRALLRIEQSNTELADLLFANPHLAAVLLGAHPAIDIPFLPRTAQQLEELSRSLAYRMGADVQWIASKTRGFLYNEDQVRRVLARYRHRLANASPQILQQAFLTGDLATADVLTPPEDALLQETKQFLSRALESSEPLRVRLHTSPPVVVFSTAGMPDLLEQTLTAYLTSFELYEHIDVPICIVDDAREQAPMMEAVIEQLRNRFKNPLLHLREWQSNGQPGEKARLRQYLTARLRTLGKPEKELDAAVERIFGPGLAGSANFIFWYLRDHAIIWLDQDSSPFTIRTEQPCKPPDESVEGYGNLVEHVEVFHTWNDLGSETVREIQKEPVDVLFLTDWLLDSQPPEVSTRLAEEEWPTREDSSYERVRGTVTGEMPPVRICTFHICGHGDYRGRLLHYQLLFRQSPPDEARKLLSGQLPFFRVLATPPPALVVGRSKTAFGTVIAFSAQQPVNPIPMLATQIRLVDFSVGILLQGSGQLSIAWAPAGLSHYRAPVTNSGRGSLAPYIWNEDLLWPLLKEVQEILQTQTGEREGLDCLRAAGKVLSEKGKIYRMPEALSAHFFYSALQNRNWLQALSREEPWLAEYVADLERLYNLPLQNLESVEYAWKSFHLALEKTVQLELQHFGEQLQLWPLIAAIPSPGRQLPP